MMRFCSFIFILLAESSTSFLNPTSQRHAVKPSSSITSSLIKKSPALELSLRASSVSGGGTDNAKSSSENILAASVAVGAITATTGFIYGKALGFSLETVWKIIPDLILEKTGSLNPAYFITSVCTFGGLLMGILSSKLNSTFTVADFVSAFSSAPIEALPSSTIHLLPLLVLSLITSTFGFSAGPEAPMVCAGALIGSSLSRRWFGNLNTRHQEILSYAGAAGALTAFMGIPIAGSIFAIEMTRANAGLSKAGGKALQPAVLSSLAAIVLMRGIFIPSAAVGGHFTYGIVGEMSGRAMITTAVACGAGGALLGTLFHKTVHLMKGVVWSKKREEKPWKRQLAVKTTIGLIVGILSTYYPQTLFWGEGSLQTVIDGQKTAFGATKHGLSGVLTSMAKVNPSLPFASSAAAAQVGVVKMIAIALACAGKFPGGIIFPLFFAAAPFAHIFSTILGPSLTPVAVFCLMGATQAAVTRTPLATALILSLSASAGSELSLLLPAGLVSSYLGVFLSRQLSRESYFNYNN